jgi:lysophospholipase L1-like esterase
MLDLAARLALAPLLAAQALHLRRHALRLPEAEGPRHGTCPDQPVGGRPALSLLIIGDSSAAGVGAPHQSQALAGQLVQRLAPHFTLSWRLEARTGATTRSTLQRLEAATPRPTDIIVTALGVNDATRMVPRPLWLAQQRRLLQRLTTLYTPRAIYMSGMPPLGAFPLLPQPLRWTLGRQALRYESGLSNLLQTTARAHHMPFDVTLSPEYIARDGLHPSPALYAVWAEKMASRILSDWPI